MKCATIASVFLCALFGGLVYLDSRSVISTSVYATICFFLFSQWTVHERKENSVTTEYKNLKKAHDAQSKKVRAQRDSLGRLREDNETLKKTMEQRLAEAQDKLTESLKNKEQELKRVLHQLDEVKEYRDKLQEKNDELEREHEEQMKKYEEEKKGMTASLVKTEKERDGLRNDVREKKEHEEQLKSEVDVFKKRVRELEDQVQKQEFQIQRLQKEKSSCEEKFTHLEEELHNMEADNCKAAQAAGATPSDMKESYSLDDLEQTAQDAGIPEDWKKKLLESPDVAGNENICKAFGLILNGSQETEGLLGLFGKDFDSRFGPLRMTPLMYACLAGNMAAYTALMGGKASCGLYDSQCNNNILHLAVMSGNNALASEVASNCRTLEKEVNKDGKTPVELAAQLGDINMVKSLLPDSWEICDKGVETVLHAVMQPIDKSADDEKNRVTIAKLVLERAKNKAAAVNLCDNDGNTPLHFACRQNYPKLVNMLLREGADPNKRNGEGKSALDYAVYPRVRACFDSRGNLGKSVNC